METIRGYVEHFIFHKEENGYAVMTFVTEDEELTVTGTLPGVGEGESLEISGEYVEHPTYGRQFKMSSYIVMPPEDEEAFRRYLGSGAVKGVGPTLAARIVKKFKKDTFRIVEEEPERLCEVKGISERMAREIAEQINEKKDLREAMLFLGKFGISTGLSVKIYNEYGPQVYQIIEQNPYRLADDVRGVGFKTADEIAAKVGVAVNSDFRIRSGILYTLSVGAGEGNTCLPRSEVLRFAEKLLNVPAEEIEPHIDNLSMEKRLRLKDDRVFLQTFYRMEKVIAGLLLSLAEVFPGDETERIRALSDVEAEEELTLEDTQREAVLTAAGQGVTVLTGGPGTGKTTTIRAIICFFENEGCHIELAAPTGRAAKRMSEATGRDARTIHRLLEVNGGNTEDDATSDHRGLFERNENYPLEADVIIIDEMSMVDTALFYSLLKAIPTGTRLVLVGDMYQLPSVGPGNVLHDIILSETVPVVRLKKIFRQAEESAIVVNAHRIHAGEEVSIKNDSRDFFFQRRYDAGSVLRDVERLVQKRLPDFLGIPSADVQVLTPMRRGPLGVEGLNPALQEYVNPPAKAKKEYKVGERLFREGDRVMQTKNNYQAEWEVRGKYGITVEKGTGVFNGDMGIIKAIDLFSKIMTVCYEENREVDYPLNQLDDLELAYAVTIHKSQGSEYPAVVLPLLSGPRPLMNRNLLYTAVTRAKSCVVIVGSDAAFQDMIKNNSQLARYSGLCERLEEQGRIMMSEAT